MGLIWSITTDAVGVSPESRARSWWADRHEWGAWSPLVPTGLDTIAGVDVSPESALTLTAALAAINVIATDFAYPPCKLYRRRADGGRDEVRDHALWELLAVTPDGETTPMRSRQALMGHVLGWGNGYYEIERNGAGEVIGLHLLDPRTRPERQPAGNRLYYRLPDNSTLPPSRIFHLAGLGYDGLMGYSPVAMAREAIALGKATELFGAAFFGNGSRPGGVLQHPGKLSPEAIARLRADWERMHRGPDAGSRVAILSEGMTFSALSIAPEDAQFLETRKFQVLEVARIYRVPPHKIGDYSESHLANIEASNLDYVITVLTPWCEAFEQEANFKLLTPRERADGYYIEIDLRALLRGDMRSRADYYTKMRDLGAMSPNEIRERENLNPIEGGDTYLVPLNMARLTDGGPVLATGNGGKIDGRASLHSNGRLAH